jgi:peptide chain release factor 1
MRPSSADTSGARLDEAEDVVDEEEHVLALVAEVLRHRQAGEAHAQPGAGRLVHLPVDERDLVDHARLGHLEHQVVALARALADAREDGDAAVLLGDVVDQLLDQDGLAHAGAAEEADLAALDVRGDQVDDLDPGLEDLDRRRQVAERRRPAVDRPALDVGGRGLAVVDRLAEDVPDAPEGGIADGHGDRLARVDDVDPAREAVGRVHRDRADAVVAHVRLDLRDERAPLAPVLAGDLDLERVVDRGQLAGEGGVDDDALDLDHLADVAAAAVRTRLVRHGSPGEAFRWVGARRGVAGGAPEV